MPVIIKLIDNETLCSLRCIYDPNDPNKKILKLDLKKKNIDRGQLTARGRNTQCYKSLLVTLGSCKCMLIIDNFFIHFKITMNKSILRFRRKREINTKCVLNFRKKLLNISL